MVAHFLRKKTATRDGSAIARAHHAHMARSNRHRRNNANMKQIGVDPILARREGVHLRSFLSAVLEERFTILKIVVTGNAARENMSGLKRSAINGFDNPDFLLSDHNHGLPRNLVKVRTQRMES